MFKKLIVGIGRPITVTTVTTAIAALPSRNCDRAKATLRFGYRPTT